MAESITAEFVGGPNDGDTRELPDLRDTWVLPVSPAVMAFTPAPDHGVFETFPVAVYKLARDPDLHRPSRNDAGRYRYQFDGIRSRY